MARSAYAALLGFVPELGAKRRLVVSPDGELHQLPFELLTQKNGERLLDSHVVSYVQSGSVLAVLRAGKTSRTPARRTLAVSSSPVGAPPVVTAITAVTRSVYDLDIAKMRPLPAADDEVRSVGSILGTEQTTVLLGDEATEAEVKRQPLQDFQVMHFAAWHSEHEVPGSVGVAVATGGPRRWCAAGARNPGASGSTPNW